MLLRKFLSLHHDGLLWTLHVSDTVPVVFLR